LIGALQRLRGRVDEARDGRHSEKELAEIELQLMQMLGEVKVTFQTLVTRWTPDNPDNLPDFMRTRQPQIMALGKALDAINADYSVAVIDQAINIAESLT
jgi:outer membrane protein TolC